MSDQYRFPDDSAVESICMDVLLNHGVEMQIDAFHAVCRMTTPNGTILRTPPVENLPDLFRSSISKELEVLEAQHPEFPVGKTLDQIETVLLGVVGLGLEGEISGPSSAPRHVKLAGREDPPEFAANELPKTSLPTSEAERYLQTSTAGSADDLRNTYSTPIHDEYHDLNYETAVVNRSLLDPTALEDDQESDGDGSDNASDYRPDPEGIDTLVGRIRSLHDEMTAELDTTLTDQLADRDEFQVEFEEWMQIRSGYEPTDEDRAELRKEVARRASLLLISRILFYELLSDSQKYGDKLVPLSVSPLRVREDLEAHFEHAAEVTGLRIIFERDGIYGRVPLESISEHIRNFLSILDRWNLSQVASDLAVNIWEELINTDQFQSRREYAASGTITEVISRLTVADEEDRVLDPACGNGELLAAAGRQKRELHSASDGDFDVLSHLYGIETDQFAAHMAAIRLVLENMPEGLDQVNVETQTLDTMSGTQSLSRTDDRVDMPDSFDVIMTDLPHSWAETDHSEPGTASDDHRSETGTTRENAYESFVVDMSELLRDGGRMGILMDSRWLDVDSGTALWEAILDRYQIEAILKLDRSLSVDSTPSPVIVLLTRKERDQVRSEHVVKFVRVRKSINIDEFVETIVDQMPADQLVRDENLQIVTRTQSSLRDVDRWGVFLRAPPIYYSINDHDETVNLGEIADVSHGMVTGANAFFYNRMEEWRELGMEEYTTPLLRDDDQITRIRLTERDLNEWGVLDIHDLVQQVPDAERHDTTADADNIKHWLAEQGHESLVEYIEAGEQRDYHQQLSTSARSPWFDLGDLDSPSMIIPEVIDHVHRVATPTIDVVADRRVCTINPKAGVDDEILCALLNSRVAWLTHEVRAEPVAEVEGRRPLRTLSVSDLLIPDPGSIDAELQAEIIDAFHDLIRREDELDPENRTLENTMPQRARLDRAVLATLGLEDQLEDLEEAVNEVVSMRTSDEVVLVDVPFYSSERQVIDLRSSEQPGSKS